MGNVLKLTVILILSCHLSIAQDAGQIQLANEYYVNGKLEKSLSIYEELADDPKNIPLIHSNYFDILINSGDFKTAERYIKKNIKLFRGNVYYKIDYGILLMAMEKEDQAAKEFDTIIDNVEFCRNDRCLFFPVFLKHRD